MPTLYRHTITAICKLSGPGAALHVVRVAALSIPFHYRARDLIADPPVPAGPAQDCEALCKDVRGDNVHERDEEREARAGVLPS